MSKTAVMIEPMYKRTTQEETLPSDLILTLRREIAGDVYADDTTRWIYSTDASIYQIQPDVVVVPRHVQDLQTVLGIARTYDLPVTPRGGGTSLGGQAVGRGIQLDFSTYFNQILEIDTIEGFARVQPGVILDQLNNALAPYQHWFGPDVAPSNRATLGGMIGNNSAGARSILYGKTVDHIIGLDTLWSDGSRSILNAVSPQEWQQKCLLKTCEGRVYRFLDHAVTHNALAIEKAFPKILRRVSGYNFDAFTDNTAHRNLAHMLTGSEGTLALWSEAQVKIMPKPAFSGLLVLYFDSVADALEANHAMIQTGPSAAELLDDMLLDLTRQNSAYARKLYFMEYDAPVILVVQYLANSSKELQHKLSSGAKFAVNSQLCNRYTLTHDFQMQQDIWAIRKAGMPLLYSRPGDYKPITFVEDTAVSPEKLRPFIAEFDALIKAHNTRAAYYAHASVGCLHIRPLIDLKQVSEVKKMRALADGVVELVQKYHGAMSGEHGDGLARSEFNPRLFGSVVYGLFQTLKQTADPQGLMNPGKIVNAPPMDTQLRYGEGYRPQKIETVLRYSPAQQSFQHLVEQCNGCGGCRKLEGGTMCPPFRVTRKEMDSTRGRANALRRLLLAPDVLTQKNSDAELELKAAMDLCIGCKACKAECPAQVDMTTLKSEFMYSYQKRHGVPLRNKLFANIKVLNHLGALTAPFSNQLLKQKWMRHLLDKTLGLSAVAKLPTFAVVPFDFLFAQRQQQKQVPADLPKVVLFNDCYMNYNHPEVGVATVKVLEALGYHVIVPEQVCCGRPKLSLGLLDEARVSARQVWKTYAPYLEQGLPIVGAEPSCVLSFKDEYLNLATSNQQAQAQQMSQQSHTLQSFLKQVFKDKQVAREALPFTLNESSEKVFFHEHCHQKALEGKEAGEQVLRTLSQFELLPSGAGCCGMAGSFGYESEHSGVSQAIAEERLLPALKRSCPKHIVVSGTSCRHQLQAHTSQPVRHWIELMSEQLKS